MDFFANNIKFFLKGSLSTVIDSLNFSDAAKIWFFRYAFYYSSRLGTGNPTKARKKLDISL